MLLVLSFIPQSKLKTWLLIDFTARPPHVFVPILRTYWLPLHAFAYVQPSHWLPFDFATRPPHVVTPILLTHLLLEVAAEDAQNPTPT